MTLTSQRVVIIGGSSGMGLATARAAAAAGAAVTIGASNPEGLKAALAGLPGTIGVCPAPGAALMAPQIRNRVVYDWLEGVL
jgi:NAD(P)-dependent dehydrogenase (short-subunit alcohol dehydrogenase family)